jgi:hypothetical protein
MNTCIVCLGEENCENLIEYNHCGTYHIHRNCLDRWRNDECIICREKIENEENEENDGKSGMCIAMSILCPLTWGFICTLLIILI